MPCNVGPALMSRGGARIIHYGASALNIVHCPAIVFMDAKASYAN
jgi:GH43 family beta-xylosidase